MKKRMVLLFFVVSLFPSFSFAQKEKLSRIQQLCQFKKTYLRNTIYDSKGAYFSVKPKKKELNHPILSLIILRDGHYGFFTKSPWKLIGIDMKLSPSANQKTVTQWFELTDTDNQFKSLCRNRTNKCQFQVQYTGDLKANIQQSGSNWLSFYSNQDSNQGIKVTIYVKGRILNFPINCDTLI